jgi:hypothetical protein
MKKYWKIVGIATLVAILGVAAVGVVAVAQEPEDGPGWNFREKLHEAIAGALGIGVDRYDAAVETAHEQVLEEAVAEGFLTQDQADRMRERAESGFRPWMPGGVIGPRGDMWAPEHKPGELMGDRENSLVSVAADELGMTVQDLMAKLRDGKSIADVAGGKVQAIADAYVARLAEILGKAMEEGRIDQERADSVLERAGERVMDQLNHTWEDGRPDGFPDRLPDGFRRGGRPGRMFGFPGQSDA